MTHSVLKASFPWQPIKMFDLFGESGNVERSQGALLRGFDDHRVANCQGARELRTRQKAGKIPRSDRRHNSDGLVATVAEEISICTEGDKREVNEATVSKRLELGSYSGDWINNLRCASCRPNGFTLWCHTIWKKYHSDWFEVVD